jgi:hypothetical protein
LVSEQLLEDSPFKYGTKRGAPHHVFFSDELVAAIERAKLKKICVEFTQLGRRA